MRCIISKKSHNLHPHEISPHTNHQNFSVDPSRTKDPYQTLVVAVPTVSILLIRKEEEAVGCKVHHKLVLRIRCTGHKI